jgi:hypothetical protein
MKIKKLKQHHPQMLILIQVMLQTLTVMLQI